MNLRSTLMRSMMLLAALAAVACGGESDVDLPPVDTAPIDLEKSTFSGSKGDVAAPGCAALGLEDGCDVCAEAAWYDDGQCDDFCGRPDPDCFAFDPLDEAREISCYEPLWGSDLVLRVEGDDLVITGTSDEGSYEDACTLDTDSGTLSCDFGFREDVVIDLTVQREEICDSMWEDTDVTYYLEGTYDGGLLSGDRALRCVLARYKHVKRC
jgi:predicted small lipoprotein YifL